MAAYEKYGKNMAFHGNKKKALYYMCKLMWNFARHCSQNRN